jgi:hypothetical protein
MRQAARDRCPTGNVERSWERAVPVLSFILMLVGLGLGATTVMSPVGIACAVFGCAIFLTALSLGLHEL